MRTYTIAVDHRERKPLDFPRTLRMLSITADPLKCVPEVVAITTKSCRLPSADYLLAQCEDEVGSVYQVQDTALVETKRSVGEIAGNVFTSAHKRANFAKCLRGLREARVRALLIEGTLGSYYKPTRYCPEPGLAMDALMRLCWEHEVPLLVLPGGTSDQRTVAAEHVARLLINGAMSYVHR